MAASTFVEMESGTARGHIHPHNGYYAGEFSSLCSEAAPAWTTTIPCFDDAVMLPAT